MNSIAIVLRKAPYGSVDAPEAVRHALGGAIEDVDVKLLLVDAGVNAARKGQDPSGTEYSNLETGIKDCIDMGVSVYANKVSLAENNLGEDKMIEGITALDSREIAGIIAASDTTMVF
ncbi:MAG: hypothetical protein EPN22_04025 [Nitrospirae bacterium]|nr:MAG: hypothetical protein EPN22_04025 [Nitrospirota bacterium]